MAYFGGTIFLKYLSNKQIVSTYILGGLTGGLFYVMAFNYFPVFESKLDQSIAVGSSASVLAILIAIATYVPNYIVNLTFIGRVKLKHIAIVSITIRLDFNSSRKCRRSYSTFRWCFLRILF